MGALQERITSTNKGSITSVQAIYVPADDLTDPAPATSFAHLDATTMLTAQIAELGIYPAVDPLDSTSRILDPRVVGEEHYRVAREVQTTLAALQVAAGHHRHSGHGRALGRGQADRRARAQDPALPVQPFHVAEVFTGYPGLFVDISRHVKGFAASATATTTICRSGVLHGRHDRGRGEEGRSWRRKRGLYAASMARHASLSISSRRSSCCCRKTSTMVTVPGIEGDFGVLAGHAPVISTLRPGVIDVKGGQVRRSASLRARRVCRGRRSRVCRARRRSDPARRTSIGGPRRTHQGRRGRPRRREGRSVAHAGPRRRWTICAN